MSDNSRLAAMNKPRKRRTLVRFNGVLVAITMTVVLCTLGAGGGWWAWSSGAVDRAVDKIHWQLVAISLRAGFKVKEILAAIRSELGNGK